MPAAVSHYPTSQSCPSSSILSLQIRLSGGRSRHEGRVEVQVGGPGPLRWGLICGDDWGTLEAMVACRQLGLGYANHGLQVSGKEGKGTKAIASQACLGQRTVEMSPLAQEPGRWGLTEHLRVFPGDLVLGLREYNRGGDEWRTLHRD